MRRSFAHGRIAAASVASSRWRRYQTWQYFGARIPANLFRGVALAVVSRLLSSCCKVARLSRLSVALCISVRSATPCRRCGEVAAGTVRKQSGSRASSLSPQLARLACGSRCTVRLLVRRASWRDRRSSRHHRVPSDAERHWHHRQHSKRRIQHCSLFPSCAHRRGVWPSWAVALGENVISCRLLRSSCGQRKTIARGLMFRAGWVYVLGRRGGTTLRWKPHSRRFRVMV